MDINFLNQPFNITGYNRPIRGLCESDDDYGEEILDTLIKSLPPPTKTKPPPPIPIMKKKSTSVDHLNNASFPHTQPNHQPLPSIFAIANIYHQLH